MVAIILLISKIVQNWFIFAVQIYTNLCGRNQRKGISLCLVHKLTCDALNIELIKDL